MWAGLVKGLGVLVVFSFLPYLFFLSPVIGGRRLGSGSRAA